MGAGLGGSLLSKVVTAVVLVPRGATSLLRQFGILPRAMRAVVLGVGCVFALYCMAMARRFLPSFIGLADTGPESFRNPQWWFVARDMGTLLLGLLAWRIADPIVALALTIGLATFLLFSFLFQINFVCVALLLGLMAFVSPEKLAPSRWLALAAFALALPAAVLSEPASLSSGFIWLGCLGGAALVALSSAVHVDGATSLLKFRTSAAIAMTALAVSGLGLVGVARGHIIADSGWRALDQALRPELKDIWAAVRRLTPRHALIFTDQVDETISLVGGWNTYAFSGQRQIYLSSYYTALELRNDRARLRQILSINDEVLRGSRSPAEVPTRGHYDQMFAVVSISRPIPPGWKKTYANRYYGLFQIAP